MPALSGSMPRKLDFVKDANCDMLYLHQNPVLNDKLILMTAIQHDRARTAGRTGELEWYNEYRDFVYKCDTEKNRREALLDLNIQVDSFLENVKLEEELSFELFNILIA